MVAARAAVDQEPAAPRAPGLGGQPLGELERGVGRVGADVDALDPGGDVELAAPVAERLAQRRVGARPALVAGDVEAAGVAVGVGDQRVEVGGRVLLHGQGTLRPVVSERRGSAARRVLTSAPAPRRGAHREPRRGGRRPRPSAPDARRRRPGSARDPSVRSGADARIRVAEVEPPGARRSRSPRATPWNGVAATRRCRISARRARPLGRRPAARPCRSGTSGRCRLRAYAGRAEPAPAPARAPMPSRGPADALAAEPAAGLDAGGLRGRGRRRPGRAPPACRPSTAQVGSGFGLEQHLDPAAAVLVEVRAGRPAARTASRSAAVPPMRKLRTLTPPTPRARSNK